MYFGDYAMYTKDMYSEQYRTKDDINIPQTCDVNNIILLAKFLRTELKRKVNYRSFL